MTEYITDPNAEKIPIRRRITIGKSLGAAAVVAWLTFWVWAFAIASPSNPNKLNTVSYGQTSEVTCAAANAEIDAMPSPRTAKTPMDRSRQLTESTRVVEQMLAELHATAESLTDVSDFELVTKWLEDYDAYLADRWRYVDKLAAADGSESAKDLAFTLSQRVSGGVYTSRIDTFARANIMPSCQVPGDV